MVLEARSQFLFILKEALNGIVGQIPPLDPQNVLLIQTFHRGHLLLSGILVLVLNIFDLVEKLSAVLVAPARYKPVQYYFLSFCPLFWPFEAP